MLRVVRLSLIDFEVPPVRLVYYVGRFGGRSHQGREGSIDRLHELLECGRDGFDAPLCPEHSFLLFKIWRDEVIEWARCCARPFNKSSDVQVVEAVAAKYYGILTAECFDPSI